MISGPRGDGAQTVIASNSLGAPSPQVTVLKIHEPVHKVDGSEWPIFLIGPLDLVGMWFGEDQRTNIIKTHV